jgi:histidine triad (HIT) family protein
MDWSDRCVFCRIAEGSAPATIVYEDREVVAFLDKHPQAPHHILIIPRRHISRLHDATDSEAALLGRLLMVARNVAESQGFHKSGYRIVINNGSGAGQSIFHLHVHLLAGRAMHWPPG